MYIYIYILTSIIIFYKFIYDILSWNDFCGFYKLEKSIWKIHVLFGCHATPEVAGMEGQQLVSSMTQLLEAGLVTPKR